MAAGTRVTSPSDGGSSSTRLQRAERELRHVLAELDELDRTEPDAVAAVVGALVSHLRSWRPESVAPLGTLPPPTEPIRDPRGDR